MWNFCKGDLDRYYVNSSRKKRQACCYTKLRQSISCNSALKDGFFIMVVAISIGNYTVREVLMKNPTRVWRNVYNTASA